MLAPRKTTAAMRPMLGRFFSVKVPMLMRAVKKSKIWEKVMMAK